MADNINVTPGTGSIVAADDIAGVLHQRVKVVIGNDGTNDGDISSSNPMPVEATSLPLPTGAATESTLNSIDTKITTTANGIKVDNSGVIQPISASALPLPTGASTEATLSALNAKVTAVNTGAVTISASALPTGASTEATLSSLNAKVTTVNTGAVTVSSSVLPTGAASESTLGALNTKVVTTANGIKVDGSGITQPVSGTVTADAGSGTFAVSASSLPLPTLAATSTKQSDGSQKTQIVDSSGNVIGATSNALDVNIKSGISISVGVDQSTDSILVYGNDGSSNQKVKTDSAGSVSINDGGNSITIDATSLPLPTGASTSSLQSTANSSLSSIDGKTPALGQALAAASVPVVLTASQLTTLTPISSVTVNNSSGASAVNIQDGGNSITVDGTITVNPLTNSSIVKSQLQDNGGTGLTSHTAGSAQGLDVSIIDGSGNQITSFGGGTQYADGTTQATPTGTAALGKNPSNVLHTLSLDSSNNLNVNLAAGSFNGANAAASLTGTTVPTSASYTGFNDGGNLVGVSKLNALPVTFPSAGSQDIFGGFVTSNRVNQIEAKFFDNSYLSAVTIVSSGGANLSQANGQGTLASSTAATSSILTSTNTSLTYSVGHEIYGMFTAAFTTPTSAVSLQRGGMFDANNGFYIGYDGTSFGVAIRKAGSDTFIAKASFNIDTLSGSANSLFTRNGSPESIDTTKLNLYRIRYGWLGIAPISFEVCSPDGNWVAFHIIREPNSSSLVSVNTPTLPMSMEIIKTSSDATNLQIQTGAWAAGTTNIAKSSNYDFSSANLTSLSAYTTPWFDTLGQGASFTIACKADQDITISRQISPDQTNIIEIGSGLITANTSYGTQDISRARYYRIVFTNSGGSTTTDTFFSVVQDEFNAPHAITLQGTSGLEIDSINSGNVNNLLVAQGATNYALSVVNSTVAQLGAGATFTGAIETTFNQQSYSILVTSDQDGTLLIKQYTDLAGTYLNQTLTFPILANVGFARSGVVNGNYVNIEFTNNGGNATTTLNINTAYGTIPSATELNNGPIALNEVNGKIISLGHATMANSLPVVIASNQSAIPVSGTVTVDPLTNSSVVKAQLQDDSGNGVTSHTAGSAKGLDVSIIDGSGNQITSFGGGTQFADGAARGTATGTLLMVDDGTNIQSVAGTTAGVLKVDLSATTANSIAIKVDGSAVTQPISASALPLPTGASTSALQTTGNSSLSSIDGKTPALGQALAAASVPVVLTAAQLSTLTPLSSVTANAGTNLNTSALNLETTQSAMSAKLPTTLGQKAMAASMAVTLASDQSSIPVAATQSGVWTVQPGNTANTTAWKVDGSAVTQPISGTVTVNPLTNSSVIKAQLQDNAGTAITVGQKAMTSSVPVVLASDQASVPVAATLNAETTKVIGTINAPPITKGTQDTVGFTTQELKNAGRTAIIFYATAIAAGTTTTETAITLVKSAGTGATSSAASFVVTNGKRFVITNISVATRGNATATVQTTTFNLRMNTAGAVTTTSTPILMAIRSATPATASAYDRASFPIPDGYEILGNGTLQIGMTAAATYTTNAPTWDVTIIGYEY